MANKHSLMNSLATAKDRAVEVAATATDDSVRNVRKVVQGVDQGVHRNPWPVIAGTAVAGIILGFMLDHCRQ